MIHARTCPQKSCGSALLLSLLLLTGLTLLSLAGTKDLLLQKKIEANEAAQKTAEQAAEHTLSWVEKWLFKATQLRAGSGCETLCASDGIFETDAELVSSAWPPASGSWMQHGKPPGRDPLGNPDQSSHPLFQHGLWRISEIHRSLGESSEKGAVVFYRLVAQGLDATSRHAAVLESVVALPVQTTTVTTSQENVQNIGMFCAQQHTPFCGRLAWRRVNH